MNNDTRRCGFVAVIGKPNSGKSTLLNAFLGQELSIVNPKAQTTRNKIKGILTGDNYQIIFLDTPGILEPKYELQNFMLSEIKSSLIDSDIILYVIDAFKFNFSELRDIETRFLKEFQKKTRIIALNKIDLKKPDSTDKIITQLKDLFPEEKIIPVSAINKKNTDELVEEISKNLPELPFLYDEDAITDRPEKFFVAEIIRQKILEIYREEIPYSVFIEIREFNERENNKDFINADIVVERETQKAIILGKKGDAIKLLGREARKEIEKFLGKEIFLKLFVKVKKEWRKDKNFLKNNF